MTIWSDRVSPEAEIGDDVTIGQGAWIDAGVVIGNRCKIQNNAILYRGVELEDGVFIGPGAIITNDRYPQAVDAHGELIQNGDWALLRTFVQRGASIGAGAVIVAGVVIGAGAEVGAGAVVTRDVAPGDRVAGNPARSIR
jgi:UDP-2-acetamido-3-amino-2,3-dideoxy-glucuronate N-acetyltransferase